MTRLNKQKSAPRQAGFSLVEMAIVLIIASFMSFGLIKYYVMYRHAEAVSHTQDAVLLLNSSIKQFQTSFSRLPCPADPTLAPGDANFGRERCTGAGITVATAPGVDHDVDGVEDEVLIGAVPFRDLFDSRGLVPLTLADSLDGWGNKLTYGVTRKLTSAATFNKEHGAISVMDEYSNSLRIPGSDTHYILVSHGPNGMGAFTRDGGRTDPCSVLVVPPTTPPEMVTALTERENCDGDSTFMIGLRRDSEFAMNDDVVRAYIMQDMNLWKVVGSDTATNTNVGNVAINLGTTTGAPTEKLHVMGNVQVPTVYADSVCDPTGNLCMPVEVLSGSLTEMQCPANQAVTRIADNQLRTYCAPYRPTRNGLRCAVGQVLVGYDASTNTLTCAPRP